MAKKYRVVCYIRIDAEEDELFETREDAEKEIENLELMQPENKYDIEEVAEQEMFPCQPKD